MAIAQGAWGDARRCLSRARALAGAEVEPALLVALGEVGRQVGTLDEAEQALEEALERTPPGDRLGAARAELGLANVARSRSRWQEAADRARRGLTLVDEGTDEGRLLAAALRTRLGLVIGYALGDTARGREEAEIAVRLLEGTPHVAELGLAYDCLAAIHFRAGDWRRQLDWNRRNLEVGERLGSLSLVIAATHVGENLRNLGDAAGALEHRWRSPSGWGWRTGSGIARRTWR
jgi:tetratricopeptide (TPR) repeat protein